MTAQTPASTTKAPKKRRISAAVKKAIDLRTRKGLMWKDAAKRAGISYQAIHKARQLPHVQEYEQQQKRQYVQDVESLSEIHKARALEIARELMEQTEDKNVRARMVEFFRREPKSAGVSVTVTNNVTHGKGYEYLPPGAHMVAIEGTAEDVTGQNAQPEAVRDMQSHADDDESQ